MADDELHSGPVTFMDAPYADEPFDCGIQTSPPEPSQVFSSIFVRGAVELPVMSIHRPSDISVLLAV